MCANRRSSAHRDTGRTGDRHDCYDTTVKIVGLAPRFTFSPTWNSRNLVPREGVVTPSNGNPYFIYMEFACPFPSRLRYNGPIV
ncbi:hypothetical protein Poly51_22190 [Rubripirellula tenax]|uniref:Uncharacterized protein n=1 Tax=Rubripirellula tenax TaxID=2528015 RepID=A0A5C6FIE9_9BACT|nr:hypothetical protein Poly51_22190 [Rubripirellula tenax]